MIEVRGLHKRFGDKQVLAGVDLEVARGQAVFLIGTSGVGKSVTIKHLVGLLRADQGEIWFDGHRIDQLDEQAFFPIRKRMGLVLQHASLFDAMTLCENVALPLRIHERLAPAAAFDKARVALAQVHLEADAERYPAELSEGMKKRAAIARTLTLAPEVVLLDEPTTGLDPVAARRIDALIRELVEHAGVTALVVSHDLTSIFGVADRVAFLYQGRIHATGTPDELRAGDDPVVQQFLTGRASGPMETPGF
ncbi:ABC transporter ATP-binding protein [Haliangium sp.]|uniref:ABC transporter ATP-binding protein n=1 Tax=Haliangium sp. TaxID=2663208 RepID=UPI003D13834D